MGLFYNNNVAGSGVAKKRPKKNPFVRFWGLFFDKFWVFFKLNLIYFLFCLPVVTFGPATAALTAVTRNFCLERPQFVWHEFVTQFKKNFKQSFIIGILDIVLAAVIYITFNLMFRDLAAGLSLNWTYFVSLSILAVLVMMNFYIFPQIVALDMRLGSIVRNSLILVFINIGGELITFVVFVGFVTLFFFFGLMLMFFLPIIPGAWLVFLSVFTCYPAIQKHIINPFYENSGERNPEIPDWELDDEDEAVFEDQGGKEEPIDLSGERDSKAGRSGKSGKGGRVIR